MAEQYVFKAQFEPILLPGETARLHKADGYVDVRVLAVTGLPSYIKDFGTISASSSITAQQDTNLEMDSWELAQLRMMVLDDVEVKLYNPSSVKLWRTAKTDFHLPKFPEEPADNWLKEYLFQASEFFIFEDEYPAFDLSADAAVTISKIRFCGWRFKLLKIAEKGKVDIWVNSWPAASGAL